MSEQPAENAADGLVQLVEEAEPFRRDARPHHPAVPGVPEPLDETPLLQPVEETGDVRPGADQPLADVPTGKTATGEGVRLGATEDAQGVVLGRRQVVSLELAPE